MARRDAWIASAQAHENAGRLERAVAAYKRVLRTAAADPTALPALCRLLQALGRSDEAIPYLDPVFRGEAATAQADQEDSAWEMFRRGQIDDALAQFEAILATRDVDSVSASVATIIPGSPAADHASILEARRRWVDPWQHAVSMAIRPVTDTPAGARRIRIGYVSSFFQERNWMKPVWGLINRHDRASFEVHLFSDAPESAIRHHYLRHCEDRFHDISELSNAAAAREIARAGIDVLVDLNGYSQASRLPLFSFRPAPVIVGWFNMYATTALECFDYLIGDAEVIHAHEEQYYTERIIRVPGSYLTFEVAYPVPEVVPPPCLGGAPFTFGCLAPQYKITPQVLRGWSRILHAAGDSRLILRSSALGFAEVVSYVRQQFAEEGVSSDRVCLEGPAEHYEFLRTYQHIDLALDSFPYSGGTTTMEALWQGVPVLTFPGDRWVSRISASLLRAAGLERFIAAGVDDYIDMAAAFATVQPGWQALAELRQDMRARLAASAVCDTLGFARHMEAAYRSMIQCAELGRRRTTLPRSWR